MCGWENLRNFCWSWSRITIS